MKTVVFQPIVQKTARAGSQTTHFETGSVSTGIFLFLLRAHPAQTPTGVFGGSAPLAVDAN
jgi:hypothetical protein